MSSSKDSPKGVGDSPRKGRQNARRIDQQGQQVGSQTNIAGDYLDQRQTAPSGPAAAALRHAYLHRLFTQCRPLSLAGIDRRAGSGEDTARVDLDAVYTALLTTTPEVQKQEEQRLTLGEARRLSALEQLNRRDRLVLLGDPGSGKSTFVSFVALCLAGEGLGDTAINLKLLTAPVPADDEEEDKKRRRQPWEHGALLPARVILRDLAARGLPLVGQPASAHHILDFIGGEMAAAGLSEFADLLRCEWLERGGLLLLDGLDEVPEADRRRAQIKQAVEDFAAAFPRCRILVTSRTYAYQRQDWRLPDFGAAILAPFNAGQIHYFVERWYAHIASGYGMTPEQAQGNANLLEKAIFERARLRELAERPLLLTLMASLHACRGGTLPDKRERLYAEAVDLLLSWWERVKIVKDAAGRPQVIQPSLSEYLKIDRNRLLALLSELAYQAHAGQPSPAGTADVREGDLLCGLLRLSQNPAANPALLVEYLSQRAGLLLPHGEGVYTFPHRTFQEYLAACYLTDHDFPDRLAELARTGPERWREVALLAGAKAARGMAAAIWLLADALCYRDAGAPETTDADAWGALLAGQALAETANLEHVGERDQPKLERARQWQVHITRHITLPALERAAAGRSLAKLGDPRPEVMTVDGMQFCYVPAGVFWMGSPDTDELASQDEHPLHQAHIPHGYWIGRYPITDAQFRAFTDAGGYREGRYWEAARRAGVWDQGHVKRGPGFRQVEVFEEPLVLPNHPVVLVIWYEALAFTRWLTARWGAAGLLPSGHQVRLPSEAEWEKAARGGLRIPTGRPASVEAASLRSRQAAVEHSSFHENPQPRRRYPWGDTPDANCASYDVNSIGRTSAAGCFPAGASPYGVEELAGNVLEWCATMWQEDYRDYQADNSAEGDAPRVVRGGAFRYDEGGVRCAYRGKYAPNFWSCSIGFRVVVAPI